ncbi:SDR family oxidoreductase [Streptomyces sp. NPDC060184]|uniref:SDR family oxidoreductase n=1 Tax=Streptomyces sp. NPDC060184 TaxID=3347064 RepID=UPI00364AE058
MSQKSRDRIAVVTGVTSGIGQSLTGRLLAEGMTVAGIARDSHRLSAAAEFWGESFHPFLADLSVPGAADTCADAVTRQLSRVDILVNNAADCVFEPPSTLPTERWRSLLETNLLACVALTRGLLPAMGAAGHIVNVSSVTARFLPASGYGPYALTKAALEHFTAALRLELSTTRTKVSLLALGLVDTPIHHKVPGFESTRTRLAEHVPDWLHPDDVADTVHWLVTRPEHVVVGETLLLPLRQPR